MVNGAEKYITIPLEKQSQNKLICDHYFYWDNNWSNKILKTIQPKQFKVISFNGKYPHYQTYPTKGRRMVAVVTFI